MVSAVPLDCPVGTLRAAALQDMCQAASVTWRVQSTARFCSLGWEQPRSPEPSLRICPLATSPGGTCLLVGRTPGFPDFLLGPLALESLKPLAAVC